MSALKLSKAPVAAQAVEPEINIAIDPEVDEFATLMAWNDRHKKNAKFKRLEELAKKFKAQLNSDDYDADLEVRIEGEAHVIIGGAKSNDRFVEHKERLIELIGPEVATDIAEFGVGKVDELLTGEQKKE